MLKNLELTYENFSYLNDYCIKNEIDFMSTPYNFEDVDLKFTEVSKYVNSPKNNDEKCITSLN